MLATWDDLFRRADTHRRRVPVAVAGAADLTVLQALRAARERGWLEPLLVGRAAEIRGLAEQHATALDGCVVLDSDEPAVAAVAEVRRGAARLLMKGQVATPALLQAMLEPARGLRTERVICQVVLMETGAPLRARRHRHLHPAESRAKGGHPP